MQTKLLKKDQYGRVVGKVEAGGSLDISLGLLQNGLATIYRGKGADYDDQKEIFESFQKAAKQNRVGMWSLGDEMTTPAEFKRQQKAAQSH